MKSQQTQPHTPTIVLAGREWDVPILAPKQNRIVVPAVLALVPSMLRAYEEAGVSSFRQLACYLDATAYERLCELVFTALTRARPDLTRAEFDELPIDTLELVQAVRVIALQAGLLKYA